MATLIFDLDGTLVNTAALMLPAYRAAIRSVPESAVPGDDTLLGTFGMSDRDIWQHLLPDAGDDQRQSAMRYSGETVRARMEAANVLVDHACDVLQALKTRGHTLTLASNCGQDYLDAILDSQGVRYLFDWPLCLGGVHGTRKADILTAHFRRFSKRDAWMIGDRHSDVEAAHAHNIRCIGCDFGFAKADELAAADDVIHSLPDLLRLFP